jgi:alkaline phosphatase D
MSENGSNGNAGFTRRRFIIGTVGVSAAAALGGTVVRAPRAAAATAPSGPPTSTLPLPAGTEPEQLLLTWGSDPAREVTVSWSAPGTVAQPAPTLAVSAKPITPRNPGRLIKLPDPKPLDVTQRHGEAAAVSFTDGLNGQTTYFYHVQLTGLEPGTRYYYEVSDGAAEPSTAGASFLTAPWGRAKFRFSSFGDLATPSWDLNTSGNIWHESCDNSWYAVTAIENPGDGRGAPLFHLLNGDLCYANLDVNNAPGVWRDFGNNIGRSAANRPWMPALGNHEVEFGVDTESGHPGEAPGGIAAQGAAGNYWNGPYGFGHYLSRFLLPDNGLVNWDGNPNTAPETTTTGAGIPNGTTTYTRFAPGRSPRTRRRIPWCPTTASRAQPADLVARGHPGPGPPRPVGRHDRGLHAPVRDVDLGPGQRLRPRYPPGLAAAVRQV